MLELKPTQLSNLVGISVPYASQIISGARKPARRLAIKIYRHTGFKMGPIANVSDADIDVLERLDGTA